MAMSPDALASSRARITEAAVHAAHLEASTELLTWLDMRGLAISTTAHQVTRSLTARAADDPLYAALVGAGLEEPWALLVVTLSDCVGTIDHPAVEDARRRGITWHKIGQALGITAQSAYSRYTGTRARRRSPRKP